MLTSIVAMNKFAHTFLHSLYVCEIKSFQKKNYCAIRFFSFFLFLARALLKFRESSLPLLSLTGVGWHHDAFSYGILVGLWQALGAWCPRSMSFPGTYRIFETWKKGVGSNIRKLQNKNLVNVSKCLSDPVNWEFQKNYREKKLS